ncbi:sphingomyelin phosphodiesterase [Acrasis kona]|uniref:Sphingomyelin phosphodiesterase n=1 Tax=Acrasis kona TaxID=1008807 RepID=A0AAW2YVW8_9EUKA
MSSFDLGRILDTPDSRTSCSKVSEYLQAICDRTEDEQSCYAFFPKLCSVIFGHESKCWLEEAQFDQVLYNNLMYLLGPDGPLFKVMFTVMRGPEYSFEFPILRLPFKVRRKIETGDISSLLNYYYYKLETATHQNKMDVIMLTMFEYYTFNFASFILDFRKNINMRAPKNSTTESFGNRFMQKFTTSPKGNPSQPDFLTSDHSSQINAPYPILLEQYLQLFYPTSVPFLLDPSLQQQPPLVDQHLAEEFLLILVDFWMGSYHDRQAVTLPNSAATEEIQFSVPFVEHSVRVMESSKNVVRHLLKSQSVPPALEQMNQNKDHHHHRNIISSPVTTASAAYQLSRHLIVPPILSKTPIKIIHQPLYTFLKAALMTWPEMGLVIKHPFDQPVSLHRILSLWSSYIFPWTQSSLESILEWKPFVICNWCFYSNLYAMLTSLISSQNLIHYFASTKRSNDLQAIDLFIKRFLHAYGIMLNGIEMDADLITKGGQPTFMNNPFGKFLMDHISMMDGGIGNYTSIVSPTNVESTRFIMRQCEDVYVNLTLSDSKLSNFNQSSSSSLPSSSSQKSNLFGFFGLSNSSASSRSNSLSNDRDLVFESQLLNENENRHRMIDYVKNIYINMGKLFGMGDDQMLQESLKIRLDQSKQSNLTSHESDRHLNDSDQQFHSKSNHKKLPILNQIMNFILVQFSDGSKSNRNSKIYHKSYLAETNPETMKLTMMGKIQVVNGLKKCDSLNVPFLGDSLYKTPFDEFEIDWLVRLMVVASERINNWIERKIYKLNVPVLRTFTSGNRRNLIDFLIRIVDGSVDKFHHLVIDKFHLNHKFENGWNHLIDLNPVAHNYYYLLLKKALMDIGVDALRSSQLFEYHRNVPNLSVPVDQEIMDQDCPERLRINLRPLADYRNLFALFLIYVAYKIFMLIIQFIIKQ